MKLLFKKNGGFTLIEILIAISILASIVTLVWSSFGSNMRGKERAEERNHYYEAIGMVLGQMSDELASAHLYSASAAELGKTPAGEVLTKTIFKAEDSGEEDTLYFDSFSNFRYRKDSKETEQAEITYKLKRAELGERDVMNLIKRVESPPDENAEEGGGEFLLLEDVRGLNFRFYDSKKKEWLDSWNSESVDQFQQMPRAVEMTLLMSPPGDEEGREKPLRFTSIALIEMAPGPNDF